MSETHSNTGFALLLFAYFLPTIIAEYRRHRNRMSVFVIDLFLGWTLIGWVVALAWAVSSNVDPKPKRKSQASREWYKHPDDRRGVDTLP